MRYSNTALKELKKRYKNILIKCAMLNAAALLAFATPAGAEDLDYSWIDSGESITINEDINIETNGDGIVVTSKNDGQYNGTQVDIKANTVSISTSVEDDNYGAIWVQTRTAEKTPPNDSSRLNITADTISISAKDNAVVAMSNGIVNLSGNTTITGNDAILARGYATVNINTSEADTNKTLKMKGNINFNYDEETSRSTIDAYVNVNLNGAESYWEGNTIMSWDEKPSQDKLTVSQARVTLNNGAAWNVTKVSKTELYEQIALNNLTVNKGTINVASGATAMVENATINGDLTLNGTLTTVEGGTINFASGSTLTTTLDSSTVKFDGNGEVAGTINLTSPTTGEYAFVADSVNVDNLSFNNGLYNIEWTDDNKTNIKITEKETSEVVDEITSNTNASTQEANAVVSLISAEGTGTEKGQLIASVISEAMQSGNTSLAVDTAKKAAPTTSQMVVGIAKEAAKTMARVAGTRMDAISGRAGGDVMEGAGLWMQALYNHTKQDATSNSDGFKANSRGLAIGVDKKVSDTTTLGFGYGYMNTDADSYGRELDVDGHNFFIYGKYQPSKWYVSSVLNYNYSKYTEKKTPLGIALRSEYDVNSYGVQLMTGYDMDNGLTPEMGLRYLDVDADSYQDGMQRIRSNHDDVLTAVAGIKYTTDVKTKDVIFKPTARLSATYDVMSDNSRANVSVIGGNNYAIDGKRLHRFGVEAGAGVTASVDNIDITLEYTGAFRQDYKSQGGMLKARYNF